MVSINSTLQEIEIAHKEKNMKQLAKEIGIGESKLKRLLAATGYEYDTAIRRWRYVRMDETNDSRNRSLWSIMEQDITVSNKDITDIETESVSESENDDITNFTQDEIRVLKSVAQQQLLKDVSSSSSSILEAIRGIPDGFTSKKTFVVQDEVIEQLDTFCEKYRIKKSDFLAVAIHDALKKYG